MSKALPFGIDPNCCNFTLIQTSGGGGGPITLAELPTLSQPGAVYLMGVSASIIEYTQPDNTVMVWNMSAPGGVIAAAFPPNVTLDKLPLLGKGEVFTGNGTQNVIRAAQANNTVAVYDSNQTDGYRSEAYPPVNLPVTNLALLTKGALITSNGTTNQVLPAFGNNRVLVYDSSQSSGFTSAAFPPAVTFDKLPALQSGELYIGSSSGVPTVLAPGPDEFFPYYDSSATNGIAFASRFFSLSDIQDPAGSINFVFPAGASGTFTFTDQGFNINNNNATVAALQLRNSNATAGAPLIIGRSAANQPFIDIVKAATGNGVAMRLYDGNAGTLLHSLTADTVASLLELAAAGGFLVKIGGVDVARFTGTGLRLLDGTVGNPSLNFAGDNTTGILRTASGIIFSIAAAQRFRVDTNGIFADAPIYPPTGTPTVTAGTGAGTGATITLASGATPFSGFVSLTTGTSPVLNGTIFTLNFNLSPGLTTAPGFLVLPANAVAANAAARFFVDSAGITATNGSLKNGNTALANGGYVWQYLMSPKR